MRESGMANAKPTEYNSISMNEVAQIKICKEGFNRTLFIRETSIPLSLSQSLTVISQIVVQISGRTLHS